MTMDGAGGQENGETHPLAGVPVLSDQRRFRSVLSACHRPNVAKTAVKVKGHSLCMPTLTNIHTRTQK